MSHCVDIFKGFILKMSMISSILVNKGSESKLYILDSLLLGPIMAVLSLMVY